MIGFFISLRRLFSSVVCCFCGIFLLLLLLAGPAFAQSSAWSATDARTPTSLAPGAPAGSYALSGMDNVNLYNGHLNFTLPLIKIGGRGEAGHAIQLPVEIKWTLRHIPIWQCGQSGCQPSGQETKVPTPNGWSTRPRYGLGSIQGRNAADPGSRVTITGSGGTVACEYYTSTLTRLTYIGPDGTESEMYDQLNGGQPRSQTCQTTPLRGKVFVTADGSSATFISDTDIYDGGSSQFTQTLSGYLITRDGTRRRVVNGNVVWVRDRNGNILTATFDSYNQVSAITDSMGRQVTITYGTPYDTISFQGSGGALRTIRIHYTPLSNVLRSGFTIQTFLQLFPNYNGSSSSQFNPTVASAVELPDGRLYQFQYNSYAELARVDLPTGGHFEYDFLAAGGVPLTTHVYHELSQRRIYLDATSGSLLSRTDYSPAVDDSNGHTIRTVDQRDSTGALLAREKHYFHGVPYGDPTINGAYETVYSPPLEGREYKTESYAANGTTLLRVMENTWVATAGTGGGPSTNPRITETATTLADINQVTKQSFLYDQYNNQTDVYEYDFGTGTAGALVRRTHTNYLTSTSYTDALTGAHIRTLPTQQQVFDAGGVERARTTYEYDNYTYDTYHAPLVDRPGISGMDSAYTSSYQTRGNATRVSRWLLSSGTPIDAYAQYDVAGNAVKTIDGRGQVTQVEYSSTYQYALPTSTTSPIPDIGNNFCSTTALVSTTAYDFSTGLVTSSTDPNGQTTTVQYNDMLDRPTLVSRPDGGWTSYEYNRNQYGDYLHTQVLQNTSGITTHNYQFFDGLGRSYRSFQYVNSDPNNPYLTADTQYDALGRVWRTSNPYMSSGSSSPINPSGNWTVTAYDSLGRVLTVTTPDNAVVMTAYNGNQVTVTDQAGKKRSSITDALGRLKQVIEDPVGLAYQTNYSYDVLGNLSVVSQGVQMRYFMYDSLSRLIRAKNPEQSANASLALSDPVSGNSQWSMGYTYDNNGNLATRTDARGITATYTYDNINRNIAINYSDGTVIHRIYDSATNGRGRLRGSFYYLNNGAHSHTAIDSYDALGRPFIQRQHFYANGSWGAAYTTQRTYNLSGSVATQTYPSDKTVTYAYDQAGRTSGFTGNLGDGVTRTYAGSISYDEWNGLAREQFGTDTPLYHKQLRNIRGQLFDTRLSSVNDMWDWNRGRLISYYSSNHQWGQSGTDNNGNVRFVENWVPPPNATLDQAESITEDQYTYDPLNRLSAVNESRMSAAGGWTWAQQFSQSYSYDRYGNRTINAAQTWGTGVNNQQFAVDGNTNRLGVPSGQSGAMQYDAAGNLINDTYSGAGTRTYDAENRMVTATNNASQQSVYTYDADGRRVRRNSFNQETWQVYGMEGELLAEYAANAAPTAPQKEYGYRNGQLLVTASAPQRTNVALSANGSTASASSYTTYQGNPFLPVKAIDGDRRGLNYMTGGTWQASTATFPQWLQIDFQGSKTIDEIDLFMVQDNYTNPSEPTAAQTFTWYGLTGFEVQYWNGSSWVNVPGGSVTGNYNVWKKLTFSAITTSKIRVLTSASPDNYSRLSEVEAWGPSTPPRINVALPANGGSASASTELIYQGYPFPASRAIDGDRRGSNYMTGGVWQSNAATFPQWLQIDFQGSKTIDEIDLFTLQNDYMNPVEPTAAQMFSTYGLTAFEVQYWNGSAWATVPGGNITGNYNVWRKITFPAITTTKIRVLANASPDGWSRITEIEAWQGGGGSSSTDIRWLVPDHLGTPRMIADRTGSLSGISRHDYLPFGEELYAGTGGRTAQQGYVADGVRQKFTQYERDNETGLDYAVNRYYSSSQGRFTGPDPYNIILEKEKGKDEKERRQIFFDYIGQPQIWNKYVYTINNPLKYSDPDGRRPLNSEDERRLRTLSIAYDDAMKAHNTELGNAINDAINEIKAAIASVPEGKEDPTNLRVVFYAIDRLGDSRYASDGGGSALSFTSNGWTISAKPNDNKCNFFVGISYALGGGIGLIGNGNTAGITVNGRYGGIGGIWGSGNLPSANTWAYNNVQNFQRVTDPALGDVAAWGARVGAGHSGIYIGGRATIYAGGNGVKLQTIRYVTERQQRPVSYQRYKP